MPRSDTQRMPQCGINFFHDRTVTDHGTNRAARDGLENVADNHAVCQQAHLLTRFGCSVNQNPRCSGPAEV